MNAVENRRVNETGVPAPLVRDAGQTRTDKETTGRTEKKKKLVFFFPWKIVSGGPFYLARLANDVAKLGLYDVYYTDYVGGLADSLLTEKSVKILKYKDERDFPIFPDEPVIVIMAEYWANVVPKVHPDTRIVFFNWHNECIPVLKRDWGATDAYIQAFLKLVSETSSVFFCDKTHWMKQCEYGVPFQEEYVPIIIPDRDMVAGPELIRPNERRIAVLGRLVVDKIYSVLDLVDNIIALRDNIKTKIYIIGEGDYENLLFDRKLPKHIKLVRCKTMPIDKVITLLMNKVDILFAMGTSVLEGATIKLPCVVVPNAMKPFECNRYPYLYESKGYALGWYPKQIDEMGLTVHTIEEIFNDIYRDLKKGEIGEKCYAYYKKNHHSNVDLLLKAIDNSTLTYSKFQEFIRNNTNWGYNLWRVKMALYKLRGEVNRRFSILGFPVYTRASTNSYHYNIFVCCIPLLRIRHFAGRYTVFPLPLVWAWRFVQAGFKKIFGRFFPEKEESEEEEY